MQRPNPYFVDMPRGAPRMEAVVPIKLLFTNIVRITREEQFSTPTLGGSNI